MRSSTTAFSAVLAVAATALLVGCGQKASDQSAGMSADTTTGSGAMGGAGQGGLAALVGSHQTSMGHTVKVDQDGSFTVTEDDSVTVHGQMKSSGDTVTITDDVCEGPGVYVVHGGASGPTFTMVSDSCEARRGDLTGDTTSMSGGA